MSNRTHVFHNTPEWLQHTNPHKRSVESLTARCEAALSCVSVSTSFIHRAPAGVALAPQTCVCMYVCMYLRGRVGTDRRYGR